MTEGAPLPKWVVPRRSEITPGFFVGRVLPFRGGRGVGPFVFLDHMGPHSFDRGRDSDVPPHPHIGLSTVTYLFEGEIDHRDSIGSVRRIRPGDVNWMTAGRGIVHSERAPAEFRDGPSILHGLQAWVALPVDREEIEPTFEHRDRGELPVRDVDGVRLRLIAGDAFGMNSPVRTHSRLFYLHSEFEAGARIEFDSEGTESAFYLVEGEIESGGRVYSEPGLLRFDVGEKLELSSRRNGTRGMILGGEPLREHRRIWWNFVSSRPERIEEAKRLWKAEAFPRIAGETEFVPLPE